MILIKNIILSFIYVDLQDQCVCVCVCVCDFCVKDYKYVL